MTCGIAASEAEFSSDEQDCYPQRCEQQDDGASGDYYRQFAGTEEKDRYIR